MEEIRYALGSCPLGLLIVAASGKGLCAIALGDEPATLVSGLGKRFPAARLVEDEGGLDGRLARIVELAEEPWRDPDLPLDARGTAFQNRVWQALREIPAGTTASYAQIALSIGAPKGARAVAGACAANPLALVIPCHRVLRSDGSLSGYRWGVARKRALLEREAGPGVSSPSAPSGQLRLVSGC